MTGEIFRQGSPWSRVCCNNLPDITGMTSSSFGLLAVGFTVGGSILQSSDGTTWNTAVDGASTLLYGVAATTGEAWAVGDAGTLRRSTDGLSWPTISTGATGLIRAVAGTTAGYYAAGQSGVLLRSVGTAVLSYTAAGTPDFFDGYKGLKGLAALHQRVQVSFGEDARFDNLRAAQVRLMPFTEDRLLWVGQRVRDLYPARDAERVRRRLDDGFLRALVAQVTAGFGGKVALAPRLFLRELVDVLDRVDQYEDFDPMVHYRLVIDEGQLRPEELASRAAGEDAEPEAVPETLPNETAKPRSTRRLEG